MVVTIMYDNLQTGIRELKYFSKYNRINARGIYDEAKQKLVDTYGQHARNYKILDLFRD